MSITSDWHIHSHNSCDAASLAVSDLLTAADKKGILDFGLTDHIHTPYNLPDIAASRREFDEHQPNPHFHFGVEASCVSQWEIDEIASGRYTGDATYGIREGGPDSAPLALGLTAEDIKTYGIEYVVGGVHWPMYVPMERQSIIREFHRQYMFMATHPLVDIIAHPWWWHGHWKDDQGRYTSEPWFDDFHVIPQSMHDEFVEAVLEHGCVVEVGITANLMNPGYPDGFKHQYLEYLAELKSRGVSLSMGSDCHSKQYTIDFERAEKMLNEVGLVDKDLWRLPPRTIKETL